MLEAVWIGFAFIVGLLARFVGLPSLVGYLAAGFVIAGASSYLPVPEYSDGVIEHVAHLGVLLLLFTVGLKLNVRSLAKPEVLGVGVAHFVITVGVMVVACAVIFSMPLIEALLVAIALGFSSTVLAAKVLEGKRELGAFHGRVAIGILIVQDLIALLVMTVANGEAPSLWALLVFALPLIRPVMYWLMDKAGHDDLLILFGLLLALVVGGYGFELVGLSSELGALAFGALLSKHGRAGELSKALWSIKEFFLVGFFLSIGLEGLPQAQDWLFAGVMLALLPFKIVLFFFLLIAFKLRARSSYLAGLSLGNYSEFGLIVASVVMPQYLVPLALLVALSFVVSAPLNAVAHPLYDRICNRLMKFERNIRHPDEQPVELGDAEFLVMGMGRSGTAAYKYLAATENVVAIDSDPVKVEAHKQNGIDIHYADAEDGVFWQSLKLNCVKAVILCLSEVDANVIAAQKLRKQGFTGQIIAHSLHEDGADKILAAGANHAYLTMAEAGVGIAEHVKQTFAVKT
ncbi:MULTISPECIES: cation:proton antiporter family protein [Gammaproteobacteria]|uniref:cation:proton antiporter family protein n=1 Tax=Gammaproteobacteria TaxID=1236 RepID=UPI000DD08DC8|nr:MULTISPECIES: cation:proton antiporter family protein [Gammaproteobacteria]RTE86268.1 sodium:proton exchanger [Aliidiomarina sp. B3213]TCZ91619.1 sodium:proton exchanger [Lysobacter sp. N42]